MAIVLIVKATDFNLKETIKDYVVGWGTLALINAGLAQGKNRSGINWFILSLITGPVATLLLVLSSNEPKQEETSDI
ncbi:hypothetical protein BBF96_08755 [Anoxybacter fermentans]|uniref:Antitermination protein NusB n=1 Tax=Anoxybacter fermentans TaxID=1323375 RepID=A0A3Q9HSV7_9FIRM|nr:hypothetical protein BBF96_08755 [Anoxybacter fermentans]